MNNILDIADPLEIARQFTLKTFDLYSSIKVRIFAEFSLKFLCTDFFRIFILILFVQHE